MAKGYMKKMPSISNHQGTANGNPSNTSPHFSWICIYFLKKDNKHCKECGEKWAVAHCRMENSMEVPQNPKKNGITIWSRNPTTGYTLGKLNPLSRRHLYCVYSSTLHNSQETKATESSSIDEQLSFAASIELATIMLSEVSQAQKDKLCIISLMWKIRKLISKRLRAQLWLLMAGEVEGKSN